MTAQTIRVAVLLGCFVLPCSSLAQQLEWEVMNRFPLFNRAEDFQQIRDAWAAGGSAAETVDMPGFARKVRDLFPLDANAWQARTGTYDASTLFRSTHQIEARLT